MDSRLQELRNNARSNPQGNTKKTNKNIWATLGITLLVLISFVVPVRGTNLLSTTLNAAGLNQAAAGIDLIVNKGLTAGLAAMQFDYTKPESCMKLWDVYKNSTIQDLNLEATAGSLSFMYKPESIRAIEGSIEFSADISKKELPVIRVLSQLQSDIVKTAEFAHNIVDSLAEKDTSTDYKSAVDALHDIEDSVKKNDWQKLEAKLDLAMSFSKEKINIAPNLINLVLGRDNFTKSDNRSIIIENPDGSPVSSHVSIKLGKYEKAKLGDIISDSTANDVFQLYCDAIDSIEYGPFKTHKISSENFDAREIKLKIKSFSQLLDIVNAKLPDLAEKAVEDEKLLKFIYELIKVNSRPEDSIPSYEELKWVTEKYFRKESVRLDLVPKFYENIKKAINWSVSYSVFVDRSLTPIGTNGSVTLGTSRDGIQAIASMNESQLTNAQIDIICKLVCGDVLTLSGNSLEAKVKSISLPTSTVSAEDWLRELENDNTLKDLAQKLQNTFGPLGFMSVSQPMQAGSPEIKNPEELPHDHDLQDKLKDVLNMEAICSGGQYEIEEDGSVRCL